MSSIDELILERRTINDFKAVAPDQQLIIDAIEVARWAPNHHLSQPWQYYLLNPQMIQQVIDLNAQLVEVKKGKQAGENKRNRWKAIPGWLIVTCERSDDDLRQQEDYAACCCSIYALSLALWNKGIGVKWTTGNVIREQAFYNICWLDQLSQDVVGLIWYGYPEQVPKAGQRRKIDEILTIY